MKNLKSFKRIQVDGVEYHYKDRFPDYYLVYNKLSNKCFKLKNIYSNGDSFVWCEFENKEFLSERIREAINK